MVPQKYYVNITLLNNLFYKPWFIFCNLKYKLLYMIEYLKHLYDTFAYEDLYLIFLSIILGLIIGWEREYKNKTAGLRTFMLVCVGSCTFTILSQKIGGENPDRLAANIITGIGFFGAGVIFKDENKINGITTACTIWVTAALGMSIGFGNIYLAFISATGVFFVLWSLVALERWIDNAHKILLYRITFIYNEEAIKFYESIFDEHLLKHSKISYHKIENNITVTWRITGRSKYHHKLTSHLLNEPSILKIEI